MTPKSNFSLFHRLTLLTRTEKGVIRYIERGGYLPQVMRAKSEKNTEKPDLIKDENRYYEDLDRMTDSYALNDMLYLFSRSKDYDIETLILNLIFKCFSQRASLIKSLRKLQVVFSDDEIAVFQFTASRVHELRSQADRSELWLLGTNKDVKVINSVNTMLQELMNCFYFSTKVDKQTSKLTDVPQQHSDHSVSYTRQRTMHSVELHKVLMTLIKDGTYILEGFQDDALITTGENQKIVTLFRNCYMLLILMCRNDHKDAKKSISKFMNIFLLHLPLLQVGQSELICEIYKHSSTSPDQTEELLSTFLQTILQKGRNPSYLRFFETLLQETNQEALQENITYIINILNDADKKYKFLFMERSEKRKQHEFSLSLTDRRNGDFPFTYHSKLVEILLDMLDKSSNSMIIKLIIQKLIPVNAVLRILAKNDCFCTSESDYRADKAMLYSLLKKPMMNFFYRIWLEGDHFTSGLTKNKYLIDIINKESKKLENLNPKQLAQLLKRKKDYLSELQRNKSTAIDFKVYSFQRKEVAIPGEKGEKDRTAIRSVIRVDTSDSSRFVYDYYTYFFLHTLPMMTKVNLIFTSPEHENVNNRKSDLVTLLSFGTVFKTNFYKLEGIINERYTFINNVKHFFEVYEIHDSDLDKVGPRGERYSAANIGLEEEAEEQFVVPELLKKHSSQSVHQMEARRLDSSLKNHTFIDTQDDERKQILWKSFVLNMSTNDTVRKYVLQERRALLKTIIALDTPEEYRKDDGKGRSHQLSLEGFVRKLILYIQTSCENLQNNDYRQESLNGSILLLTDILSTYENEAEMLQRQSLLYRCQAVKIACSVLFKKDMPKETQKLMVHFCTKMLDGGNTDVQMAFYGIFTSDPNSENFFSTFYELLSAEISRNSKRLSPTQQAEICIQDWEYVDELFHFNLSMILRLMQLFAENHNSDLQAYFREQTNSKNNYNMISLLVRLADALHDNLTQDKYKILLQCMDTLSEFIQGPCLENQASLANNQFIEVASQSLQVRMRQGPYVTHICTGNFEREGGQKRQ